MIRSFYLYIKLYVYWHLSGSVRRIATVVLMFITREKRMYYLYSTKELVIVTWYNYFQRVKMDAPEFGLIEFRNARGETTWSKAERF